jgi:hypothetical protein
LLRSLPRSAAIGFRCQRKIRYTDLAIINEGYRNLLVYRGDESLVVLSAASTATDTFDYNRGLYPCPSAAQIILLMRKESSEP